MEAKDLHKPPLATAAMTQAKPAPAKATTAPTGAVPSNGAANAKDPISRLRVRRAKAMEGGGAARIQAQHDKGKYTARERVDLLCDPGTFVEIDAFVRTQASISAHLRVLPQLSGSDASAVTASAGSLARSANR